MKNTRTNIFLHRELFFSQRWTQKRFPSVFHLSVEVLLEADPNEFWFRTFSFFLLVFLISAKVLLAADPYEFWFGTFYVFSLSLFSLCVSCTCRCVERLIWWALSIFVSIMIYISISSSLVSSVGKPPCGAEPRIELGPALQRRGPGDWRRINV
jgi:hypothetical protein